MVSIQGWGGSMQSRSPSIEMTDAWYGWHPFPLAAAAFYWAGTAISLDALRIVAGFALIAASLYVWLYGHRHRVRFGMTIGLAGLTVWSFLMATAHGAGLMLWPALLPLCSKPLAASWSTPLASVLLAVTVHTIAMLVVTTAVAQLVYAWAGLALLRHTWINVDIAWVFAIGLAGIYLLTAG
jgi:hypothetical protein